MSAMVSLKAHFDGRTIVLDEPSTLVEGQAVRVILESDTEQPAPTATRKSLAGFAGGTLDAAFTPFVDMTATLMNGDEWDESAALHIDPLEALPADFVRRPGSAAGQIKMADDFNDTPDDFEEYL